MGEQRFGVLFQLDVFLNGCIVAVNIQMRIHRQPDGSDVGGGVPCNLHTVGIGHRRQFQCWGNSPQLGHMAPQIIHQPVGNQGHPLGGIVEQLAGSDRRSALAAQLAQPGILIRRQQVLDKIRMILLSLCRIATPARK